MVSFNVLIHSPNYSSKDYSLRAFFYSATQDLLPERMHQILNDGYKQIKNDELRNHG